jgi:hypothetical protein
MESQFKVNAVDDDSPFRIHMWTEIIGKSFAKVSLSNTQDQQKASCWTITFLAYRERMVRPVDICLRRFMRNLSTLFQTTVPCVINFKLISNHHVSQKYRNITYCTIFEGVKVKGRLARILVNDNLLNFEYAKHSCFRVKAQEISSK